MKSPSRNRPLSVHAWFSVSQARAVLIFLALTAFFFQSYVVQTHIHGLPHAAVSIAANGLYSATSPRQDGKLPLTDDQDFCPMCQAAMHAGAFVVPVALAALPVALAVSLVPLALSPAAIAKPVSHIWRGRAPPIHR